MRIVQINTFSNKSTGNIMLNIHKLLTEAAHDSYVVWGRGRASQNEHEIVMDDEFGVKLHGLYTRLTDKTGFASKAATSKLVERLGEIQPDIIHLHNIHGYYINLSILFNYIKVNNVKVVWTLHDCWPFTGHCTGFEMCGCNRWRTGCHHCVQKKEYPASLLLDNSLGNWRKKRELFSGLDAILITPSEWLRSKLSQSFLSNYKAVTIHNGIDRTVFKPSQRDQIEDVKRKYGLDERPIILGVASEWLPRKGMYDFLSLSALLPDMQVVIVGVTDKQKKKLPETLRGIARTESVQELANLYSAASVFFNPTYEDNFPTTNIEALACGTPILTYDTGGSPEAVISADVGRVIEKDSPDHVSMKKVKEALEDMMKTHYHTKVAGVRCSKNDFEANSVSYGDFYIHTPYRKASEQFDKNQRLREYITLYESFIG